MASTRLIDVYTQVYVSGNLGGKSFLSNDVAYRIDMALSVTSRIVSMLVITPDAVSYTITLFGGAALTVNQNYTDCFAVPLGSTVSIVPAGSCTVAWCIVDHVPGSVI